MQSPLTERQKQIFDAIKAFLEQNGYSPTVKEIGRLVGIRSTNGVAKQLAAIERKGHLRRTPNRARSIQLIEGDQPVELPVQLPFVSSFTGVTRRTLRSSSDSVLTFDRMLLGRLDPSLCLVGVVGDDGMGAQGIRTGDLVVFEERTLSRIPPQSLVSCLKDDRLIVRRLLRLNELYHLVPDQPGFRTELIGDGAPVEVVGMIGTIVRAVR